ncbi:MAG TPA: ABC transporter permease [Jatrophihabitans sp.]|jgi:ribose transport system permease protein|uniref:ABC transporter permease n=1 Tax=Jatrophihabitans sp. TaxID=1932789 RepID=UPI002F1230EF
MADTLVARSRPRLRAGWMQDYGVYVALAAILLANLLITDHFVTLSNLRTQLVQVVPVLIIGLGMALVIGTEGIDLSVGSVMALAAALLPLYLGYGALLSIVMALLAGLLVGALNGWLIAYVGVQPIVATLALLVGGRGLATVIGGAQKDIRNQTLLDIGANEVGGVPIIVAIAAVLTIVVSFVVRKTTFGRQLVAVGGNRIASELGGLPVKRILITVYVLSGVLAAVAGVIATARLTASTPNTLGLNLELSAITAVVVGGTPLTGGRVRVLGVVAGAILMQLIRSTLIAHNLHDSVAQMTQAAIILIAVYAQRGRVRT